MGGCPKGRCASGCVFSEVEIFGCKNADTLGFNALTIPRLARKSGSKPLRWVDGEHGLTFDGSSGWFWGLDQPLLKKQMIKTNLD